MPKTRDELYKRFSLTSEQVDSQPEISTILRRSVGGREKVFELLKSSSEVDAQKLVKIFVELGVHDSKYLPLEAYALAAGLTTRRMFELVAGEAFAQSAQESALVAAVAHPNVVRKTVKSALKDKGINDRRILHQHAGFLPMPKTQFVSMKGGNFIAGDQKNEVKVAILPPAEETVRRLSDRFNEQPPLMIAERVIESGEDEDEEADDV